MFWNVSIGLFRVCSNRHYNFWDKKTKAHCSGVSYFADSPTRVGSYLILDFNDGF